MKTALRAVGRIVVFSFVLALIAAGLWRAIGRQDDFEAAAVRAVAVMQAAAGTTCPLAQQALETEELSLVSICSEYGLAAYVAAKKYPDIAPVLFATYGEVPEFRVILERHGAIVLPVIQHFRESGSSAMRLRVGITDAWEKIKKRESIDFATPSLSQDEYGYLAVQEIRREGNRLLSEFVVADGTHRLWTPRIANMAFAIFASGVSDLESAIVRGEKPTWQQVGWAALDAAIVVGSVSSVAKAIKAAKTARVAKTATLTGRFKLLGAKTLAALKLAGTAGKLTGKTALALTPVAVVYLGWKHPGLIASGGAWVAEQAGLPGWFGIFLVVLVLALPMAAGIHILWTWVRIARRCAGFVLRRIPARA